MGFGAGKDVLNGMLHVRVTRITQVSQRRSQVTRANKDAVDAVCGSNGVDVINTLLALNLYQDADVVIGLREVVRHGAKHIGAMRNGYTADPFRGIAR